MSEAPAAPAPFRDQSLGLAAFGAVLFLLGLGSLALPPFLRSALPRPAACEFAAGTISLGVGSILARRWAIAILLCLGAIHFIFGMLTLPGSLILMFYGQTAEPAFWARSLLQLGLPAAVLAFYSQPAVRRTCEARDPVERWTDRCPLLVLACCVFFAEQALSCFESSASGQAMPFVGRFISGPSGRGLWLALALFTLYSVVRIYRFDRRIWSVYSSVFLFYCVSSLLTLVRIRETQDFSAEMGADVWSGVAGLLIGLACLVFARFSFPPPPESP